MAKRTKSAAGPPASEPERSRLIKVMASDDELKDIRVAAALEDVPISAFARDAALQHAADVIRAHYGKPPA